MYIDEPSLSCNELNIIKFEDLKLCASAIEGCAVEILFEDPSLIFLPLYRPFSGDCQYFF